MKPKLWMKDEKDNNDKKCKMEIQKWKNKSRENWKNDTWKLENEF